MDITLISSSWPAFFTLCWMLGLLKRIYLKPEVSDTLVLLRILFNEVFYSCLCSWLHIFHIMVIASIQCSNIVYLADACDIWGNTIYWTSGSDTVRWICVCVCVCRSTCVQGRKREAMLQIGLFLWAPAPTELCRGGARLQAGRRATAECGVTVWAEDCRAAHHRATPNWWRLLDWAPS